MFRPSVLAIFRLYMRNLSIGYTNMWGEFTVCGVGWVRDLVLCWRKGVWTGVILGIVLKHSCLLTAMPISGLHFLICIMLYWKNYIIYGLSLRCYCIIQVPQEECARLREGVPYVKVYRYNPQHLYPKLNGYGDNDQRSLKL